MLGINSNDDGHFEDGGGSELSEFIKPTDEVEVHYGPDDIEFWIEKEHREAEDEQRHAYEAKGEVEARSASVQAAGLKHDAEKAEKASDTADEQVGAAKERSEAAHTALEPHLRRPRDAKQMKYPRWGLILLGDVVGTAGAALLLGELVINAFMIAISVAAAAVTLGAVGRELRYMLGARARQKKPDELTDAERPFAAFFAGPHAGEALVKIVLLVALAGIAIIATGIFALRDTTEGMIAGLTFGCFAIALGLASFANAFDAADDIAEYLDNQDALVQKAEKRAERTRGAPVIKQHATAEAEASSIRAENQAAGEAAAAGVRRHLYHALGNSGRVAGNGRRIRTHDANGNGHNHVSKPDLTKVKHDIDDNDPGEDKP